MTQREVTLEGGVPWGFRMHGGVDLKTPLKISRVNPGSKAAQRGIREGDLITSINDEGTKHLTNNEAHNLLKKSGSTLKLGLNEDIEGSPKKRQYRTIHHETHQETVKRSSVTYTLKETIERSSPRRPTNNEFEAFRTDEFINGRDTKQNGDVKVVTNIPVSQKSTPSSSSTSTPSTLVPEERNISSEHAVASRQSSYSNCSSIPDEGSLQESQNYQEAERQEMNDEPERASKSKRRRQRRKNVLNRTLSNESQGKSEVQIDELEQTNVEDIVLEPASKNIEILRLKRIEHKYKVESPKELKIKHVTSSDKKLKTKSKSLDDDDLLKIQELSEASESEDTKYQPNVVISEASSEENLLEDSDCDLQKKRSALDSICLQLNADNKIEAVSHISPEEEQALRNFLGGLNLVNTPEESAKDLYERTSGVNDSKTKKLQKRKELEDYFVPIAQNPRYLDAISEEASDISDKECAGAKSNQHIKQSTPEQDALVKKTVENPILVETKVLEPLQESICSTKVVAIGEEKAEVVYLDDSSASSSNDDFDDAVEQTDISKDEDLGFRENLVAQSEPNDDNSERKIVEEKTTVALEPDKNKLRDLHVESQESISTVLSSHTSTSTKINQPQSDCLDLSELTPPLTPDGVTIKTDKSGSSISKTSFDYTKIPNILKSKEPERETVKTKDKISVEENAKVQNSEKRSVSAVHMSKRIVNGHVDNIEFRKVRVDEALKDGDVEVKKDFEEYTTKQHEVQISGNDLEKSNDSKLEPNINLKHKIDIEENTKSESTKMENIENKSFVNEHTELRKLRVEEALKDDNVAVKKVNQHENNGKTIINDRSTQISENDLSKKDDLKLKQSNKHKVSDNNQDKINVKENTKSESTRIENTAKRSVSAVHMSKKIVNGQVDNIEFRKVRVDEALKDGDVEVKKDFEEYTANQHEINKEKIINDISSQTSGKNTDDLIKNDDSKLEPNINLKDKDKNNTQDKANVVENTKSELTKIENSEKRSVSSAVHRSETIVTEHLAKLKDGDVIQHQNNKEKIINDMSTQISENDLKNSDDSKLQQSNKHENNDNKQDKMNVEENTKSESIKTESTEKRSVSAMHMSKKIVNGHLDNIEFRKMKLDEALKDGDVEVKKDFEEYTSNKGESNNEKIKDICTQISRSDFKNPDDLIEKDKIPPPSTSNELENVETTTNESAITESKKESVLRHVIMTSQDSNKTDSEKLLEFESIRKLNSEIKDKIKKQELIGPTFRKSKSPAAGFDNPTENDQDTVVMHCENELPGKTFVLKRIKEFSQQKLDSEEEIKYTNNVETNELPLKQSNLIQSRIKTFSGCCSNANNDKIRSENGITKDIFKVDDKPTNTKSTIERIIPIKLEVNKESVSRQAEGSVLKRLLSYHSDNNCEKTQNKEAEIKTDKKENIIPIELETAGNSKQDNPIEEHVIPIQIENDNALTKMNSESENSKINKTDININSTETQSEIIVPIKIEKASEVIIPVKIEEDDLNSTTSLSSSKQLTKEDIKNINKSLRNIVEKNTNTNAEEDKVSERDQNKVKPVPPVPPPRRSKALLLKKRHEDLKKADTYSPFRKVLESSVKSSCKGDIPESSDMTYTNVISPPRPASANSDSSTSEESSRCTAKYNPNSSIADVASIAKDEENCESNQLYQPISLRDLVLKVLVSLPFGEEILKELAEVSKTIEHFTTNLPFKRIDRTDRKHILENEKDEAMPGQWYTQKDVAKNSYEDERRKIVELHQKFLTRRKYSEGADAPKIDIDNDRVRITGIDARDVLSPNRLLTIIREEPSESEPPNEFLNFEDNSDQRLKAKNLGEWLTLARNKSKSTSSLDCTNIPINNLRRSITSTQNEQAKFSNTRRFSLPQEIYEKQLIDIMEKEREIQRELELLEEEKRKLRAEIAPSRQKEFQVNDFYVSKKGDFAERREDASDRRERPASMPVFPTEFFRQQMYEEYMDKFSEREERKQQKVIKISSSNDLEQEPRPRHVKAKEIIHPIELEQEFMDKVKEKLKRNNSETSDEISEGPEVATPKDTSSDEAPVIVLDGDKVKGVATLPRHLQEFVDDLTTQQDDSIWSPGQPRRPPSPQKQYQRFDSQNCQNQNDPVSPVWTPKSASSSPTVERKEFRPVNFQSPVLSRKNRTRSETIPTPDSTTSEPPWKLPEGRSDTALNLSSTLDRRLPTSQSSPGFGSFSTSPRLPKAQNPTITLLQKAREGQLPRGAHYIDQDRRPPNDRPPIKYPGEVLYHIKNEYTSESDSERPKKMADLAPRKFEGIGPTTKDGMPLILRSEVQDKDQSKWYKRMYDTIHKQKPHRDEYVTIRYKQKRAQYPYTSGYLSEPEPGAYDSDFTEYKYQTLDRRRTPHTQHYMSNNSTMPRSVPDNRSYSSSDIIKNNQERYSNLPGRIENYRPGHSSISEKEAKQWWDEVMDIFDGHLEQQSRVPPPKPRSFINQALKESGYESDSTLVFKRKEETAAKQLNPKEQREAYKTIQRGGDVPFQGLRKPAPERPKDKEASKSMEELAEILGCPVGEVEKMKEKFDKMREQEEQISLMGHMYTSSPNLKELRDITPYLTANWIAHRYPRSEDNTRSLSSPEHSLASRDTSLVRKDRHRPKSSSPLKHGPQQSILKQVGERRNERFETSSRYTKEPDLPPPPPPPKSQGGVRSQEQESPRKYVENEVTIHYKTPVRTEIKEYVSEDELAHRQAEAMKKIYEEERKRKYLQVSKSLQELHDMKSRRHTDNFIPSQKSPIPLNRYDDFDDLTTPTKTRTRSPEPRLVAKALYNFVGQTARELTFRKGDLIYVRRQVDKNWYEGELNAMVGLFPVNYVEIVHYEGIKTTPRKAHEGQARAKYNFLAQTHLELSLAKGELVTVTRRVDDNWFEGKIGGRKGIFPVSYVDILIDPSDPPPPSTKPVASPAAHSLLLNGSSQGRESMGSHLYTPNIPNPIANRDNGYHRAKPVQLSGSGTYSTLPKTSKSPIDQTLHIETQAEPVPYRALYKYTPQNDDELELLEGDTVYVLEKCDDGWYVGSSERTGAFGTFPGNYVEKI